MAKYNNSKSLETETMAKEELKGIKGWLLYFLIIYYLAPIIAIGMIFLGVVERSAVLTIEGIILLIFSAHILNLILHKKKSLITWMKGICIFLYVIIGIYLAHWLLNPSEPLYENIAGIIISNTASYFYFSKSVRVKNTFVN